MLIGVFYVSFLILVIKEDISHQIIPDAFILDSEKDIKVEDSSIAGKENLSPTQDY